MRLSYNNRLPCSKGFAGIVLLWFLIEAPAAFAYPEMVRYGYTNCTSCHVSPTGGGVLTEYGRALSKETLSTWSTETETEFAYGLVKSPEWLLLGGDYRNVYLYQNNPQFQSGQYIYMQGDLEAAATWGRWTLDASGGYQNRNTARVPSDFTSNTHYLIFRATDEIAARAGKYFYSYGINTPDHSLVIKRDLGWDEGLETYNLEASWISEKINVWATAVLGRPETQVKNVVDSGAALNGAYALTNNGKVGVSVFAGSNVTRSRVVTGPYLLIGFTPKFYLLSELDIQEQRNKAPGSPMFWGLLNDQELGYELVQGFHAYLLQEYERPNFGVDRTTEQVYGGGLKWYPRPHFEFQAEWQKQQIVSAYGPHFVDFAFFLVHFYL